MGYFLVIVPSSGLLNYLLSFLQKLNLPRSGAELCTPRFTDRQIDIRPHGTLLQLTIRGSQILDDQPELLQISNHLICGAHIRL